MAAVSVRRPPRLRATARPRLSKRSHLSLQGVRSFSSNPLNSITMPPRCPTFQGTLTPFLYPFHTSSTYRAIPIAARKCIVCRKLTRPQSTAAASKLLQDEFLREEEITYLAGFLNKPSSEPRYYRGIHGRRDFHVSGDYATIAFSSATAPYRLCETVWPAVQRGPNRKVMGYRL